MLSIKSNSITEEMIMTYIGEGLVGLGAVFILLLVLLVIWFMFNPPGN